MMAESRSEGGDMGAAVVGESAGGVPGAGAGAGAVGLAGISGLSGAALNGGLRLLAGWWGGGGFRGRTGSLFVEIERALRAAAGNGDCTRLGQISRSPAAVTSRGRRTSSLVRGRDISGVTFLDGAGGRGGH